jgi:hypothetical protein
MLSNQGAAQIRLEELVIICHVYISMLSWIVLLKLIYHMYELVDGFDVWTHNLNLVYIF